MAGIKENKLNDEDVEQVTGGQTYTLDKDEKGNYLCPVHHTALEKEWKKIRGEVYVCHQCHVAYRLHNNHGNVFFTCSQISE